MKSIYRFAPLTLLLLALAGCQTSHIGPSGSQNGTITHVVIMWLYDPGDETAQNEVLGAGKVLETLPGVLNVAGGKMVPTDRPVVDHSYDLAFVVTLKDNDALKAYLENPQHADLKKTVLDRYVRKYVVYDFIGK